MRIVLQFTLTGEETDMLLMKIVNETVKACNYSTPSKPYFLVRKGNTVYAARSDRLIGFLNDGYEIVAVIQKA